MTNPTFEFTNPTEMRKLKQSAKCSAMSRKHKLGRFMALHSRTAVADCQNLNCHASVYVTTDPRPNEIDVSGLAVTVDCGDPVCCYVDNRPVNRRNMRS